MLSPPQRSDTYRPSRASTSAGGGIPALPFSHVPPSVLHRCGSTCPPDGVELTQRGTRTAKHFALPDGCEVAVIAVAPVHYQDLNRAWQDIDIAFYRDRRGLGVVADLCSLGAQQCEPDAQQTDTPMLGRAMSAQADSSWHMSCVAVAFCGAPRVGGLCRPAWSSWCNVRSPSPRRHRLA